MRAVLALAVIGLLCGAVTAQDNPKVIEAIRKVEASFSNITHLTTAPGLGALFTPDGVWCSLMGSPCNVGAANITAYVNGFKGMLKMTDLLRRLERVLERAHADRPADGPRR